MSGGQQKRESEAVKWRGGVVSVTLRRQCASKSRDRDSVLYYPAIKTFVGTLNGSLTSWRNWLRSSLETKTAGSVKS